MGSLLVVSGPPGAGKSTVARAIIDLLGVSEGPTALVEGDVFFSFLAGGAIEPWLPESHQQNTVVTEAMALATCRFASAEFVTIFDGVLGPWLIDMFMAAGALEVVDYAILLPNVETCVGRVQNRVDHGFRDLPAARKMHSEFAGTGIAPSHVITNSHASAHEVAQEVLARRDNGRLTYEPKSS